MLVKSDDENPYRTMLTAGHEDTLATWIDGQVVLLSPTIAAAFPERDCMAMAGLSPDLCGVLDPFGWSSTRFAALAEGRSR